MVLPARIADPLWMLARQWQSGEFQAEDAGTPLQVKVDYSTHRPTRLQLGESQPSEDLGDIPLEKWVEQEWLDMDWRTSIRVGQKFEQLLKAHKAEAIPILRDEFPGYRANLGNRYR